MKLKNLLFIAFLTTLALSSCNNSSSSKGKIKASLKTEKDTVDYYLGVFSGMSFKNKAFENPNLDAFNAGVNNCMNGDFEEAELYEMDNYLKNYYSKMQIVIAENNKKAGDEFLAKNVKKSGVTELVDGIQYKIVREGTGAIPSEMDMVRVHYKGTLIDGTEFDSSYTKGEPAEFPVNGVIQGWTKALTNMPVGSKWTIYVPSDQAYGARGAGNSIGPNETLIFDVELLDIVSPQEPAE